MGLHIRVLAGRVDRAAGSHVYHQELVRRLAARGHRLSLVCFQTVPEVTECADVYEISRSNGPPGRLLWRFTTYIEYRHCSRRLRQLSLSRPDVVIGGEHLFLKGHWQRFPETPWIYLPHSLVIGQEIDTYGLPGLMHWVTKSVYEHLQAWALQQANRTLRFTRQGCQALAQRYGPDYHPRFFVNPMAVELPVEAKPKVVPGPLRLLFVGRLVCSKNLNLALQGLAGMKDLSWRLDVLGDGERRAALEAKARELGLESRVAFHGHQPDPSPWYSRADLFVFPSLLESCGIVLLEAMSHGVPCLALQSDGREFHNVTDEIISHGRTGLLAKGAEDFCRQLRQAIEHPESLEDLGRAAREHVNNEHTWSQHLDRYEELFEELMVETGGRRRSVWLPAAAGQG